jgi:O-antigen ligase
MLAILVVLLQLVPLSPEVWRHLGPRGRMAADFAVLGMPVPAEPLSVAPADGLTALLGIIPPLALICAMVRLKAYRPRWVAIALIAGTVAGIALGTLQAASSSGDRSPWYLYEETNLGSAVGFFANANHMGTLLVVTIPFLAAIVASVKKRSMQRYSAVVAVAAGLCIVIIVGLALNGSLAGYGLTLPALAASALIILPPSSRLRLWVVGLAALLVVGAVTALETTAIGASKIGEHSTESVQSRSEILATTSLAIGDFMPLGSGLGSFQSVYPLYERADQVTNTFVVHAHNDYAELILELGVPGIILILLFLAWWGAAVWRVWRTAEAGPFARAAAIASAAILVHSLVDFPLRTEAIAALFGMCLALLADSRAAPPKEEKALRKGRHREIR